MHLRPDYISKIEPFLAKPVIKLLVGMRRVGKSCLMKLLIRHLMDQGVKSDHIIYIDKELFEFDHIRDYRDLEAHVKDHDPKTGDMVFIFIDEVQEIHGWQRMAASWLKKGGFDIILAGSNAQLFAGELATLLAGRYVEVPVYGLSFKEHLLFRGADRGSLDEEFGVFLRYGGLPGIHHLELNDAVVYQYLDAIFQTIVLKDIVKRHGVRNVSLLERVVRFVFDNVGNIFSANRVRDFLKSTKNAVSVETVQNYLQYLQDALVLTRVNRFDLKGKRLLEFYEKYFVSDLGLRHSVLSFRQADISGLLENVVFLELKRRGYAVRVGKVGECEVDFVANKGDGRVYIQVAYVLATPDTVERELRPLLAIPDHYPKWLLSMDRVWQGETHGVRHRNLVDFLTEGPITPNG